MNNWEERFETKIIELDFAGDPAHDLAHFKRVVATAKNLCKDEGARLEVVLPAAWLHDFVNVPKNDPRRSQASRLAAAAALEYLESINYPREFFDDIRHAIEAHSFSAKIEPRTLEAKIVQDADRLDGLGAIGIARLFSVSGLLKRSLYHPETPFGGERELDDLEYAVDHFYVKLFKTAETLQTAAGRAEGIRRAKFMQTYLQELAREIGF
jgi:uncharacterized protein